MAAIMEVDEHMNKSFSQASQQAAGPGRLRFACGLPCGCTTSPATRPCGPAPGTLVARTAVNRYALGLPPTACESTQRACCPTSPICAMQFDPAPRRGEPEVTRRTPDYFL